MPDLIYNEIMDDKELVWLQGEIKTPPFTSHARTEAGFLLRRLQKGEMLAMPRSRAMPVIGSRCHELRIQDADKTWRIIYRIDLEVILILEVFEKVTQTTPQSVIDTRKRRLARYDSVE